MKKSERKRVAREKKARAKAARKAKAAEPAASTDAKVASASDEPARSTREGPSSASGQGARASGRITKDTTDEELRADPELMEAVLASQHRDEESFELSQSALEAEVELNHARGMAKEASANLQRGRKITDERALEMLEDAAECTHDVLMMVKETLKGVSPERIEAARAVLNAKPQTGTEGRKLPRRAPDPVVTLVKIELQASSLLKRILAKTNPNACKKVA